MTKKSILRPLCGAALVAAAALFAGCSDVYTGGDADSTTVSFAGAEAKHTQPDENGELASIVTNIRYDSIEQAAEDSTVELTFTAKTRLDEESIKVAVAFYAIEERTITVGSIKRSASPTRTEQLPSSLLVYGEPDISRDGVLGTARFRVDTSKVDNGKIAVMVDATKLKDKRGNFVLNGDGNETAGEESDSWIDYITVDKDKDGNGYDKWNITRPENLAPKYLPGVFFSLQFNPEYTTSGMTYQLIVDGNDGDASTLATDGKYVYNTGLASTLAGIYSVQVKKAGETSWTDKSLTFTYQSDSTKTNYGFYVATTETLSAGDKIRLVTKTPTKTTAGLSDTTNATQLYGHPAYMSYKAKSYTFYGYERTSSYHATEPSYIVQTAADMDKFAADDYDDEDITSAQQSFFDKWERIGKNKWLVSLEEEIWYDIGDDDKLYPRFDKIDGFKVVLDKDSEYGYSYTELNATITKIDDNRTVLIELPSYYDSSKAGGTIELWVGSGTTITGNTLHPTQKTFGSFVDVSKGVVSGYVKLIAFSGDGGTVGGGPQNPSNDVKLAGTTWRGSAYDYDEGMNISITINFHSNERFSVDIYYDDYGYSYPDYISGTYDVWENAVSLYGDDDERLSGYVNEDDRMTVFYNGATYTLWKQD